MSVSANGVPKQKDLHKSPGPVPLFPVNLCGGLYAWGAVMRGQLWGAERDAPFSQIPTITFTCRVSFSRTCFVFLHPGLSVNRFGRYEREKTISKWRLQIYCHFQILIGL